MHEAGLAAAIASAIREGGLVGRPVRVLVTGGHDEPSAFDASLRFHLASALPEADTTDLAIVHLPSEHWCASCGRRFDAIWDEPCPDCGGAGLPSRLDEGIELEVVDGPGPSDPSIGDGGPSAEPRPGAQAGDMEGSGVVASGGASWKRPDGQVT